MQARYAVGVLSGKYALPTALNEKQIEAWDLLCAEYPAIPNGDNGAKMLASSWNRMRE